MAEIPLSQILSNSPKMGHGTEFEIETIKKVIFNFKYNKKETYCNFLHYIQLREKKLALYYFWRKLESGKTLKLIENSCQTWLTWQSIHQFLVNINEID